MPTTPAKSACHPYDRQVHSIHYPGNEEGAISALHFIKPTAETQPKLLQIARDRPHDGRHLSSLFRLYESRKTSSSCLVALGQNLEAIEVIMVSGGDGETRMEWKSNTRQGLCHWLQLGSMSPNRHPPFNPGMQIEPILLRFPQQCALHGLAPDAATLEASLSKYFKQHSTL